MGVDMINGRGQADDFTTVADVAVLCGVSKIMVYRLIDSGHLHTYRVGERRLISLAEARIVLGTSAEQSPNKP
ncbi:MAG TPA: helix-turn-helix domain-containing protein [Pseudonocardia sp.]|nr:helix-turn-helix domain-containing protein [Pseudonocardia sp.]